MTRPWFPRPRSAGQVELLATGEGLTPRSVVELLADTRGVEWRDRVGVVGRADGSGKSSTRLLAVNGWVAKTRTDQVTNDRDALRDATRAARRRALSLGLWHPRKQWILIHDGSGWYPMTLCPELCTLRSLPTRSERMRDWIAMTRKAIRVSVDQGVGLDINPSNFGREVGNSHLYYIDDELYDPLTPRHVAGALVARIPEEQDSEPDAWEAWGERVCEMLWQETSGWCSWDALCDEVTAYPLTERFDDHRMALLKAFRRRRMQSGRSRHRRTSRELRHTCVLADVHANLPALEAVLTEARALGADSYLFVGDAVGYGPHPNACVERLADLPGAIHLRGNHDHAIAHGRLEVGMNRLARRCADWTMSVLSSAEVDWLKALPVEHVADDWMAVHGAPRDPHRFLAYVYDLTYEDNLHDLQRRSVQLCFYGHTHVQLVHADEPSGVRKLQGPEFSPASASRALVNPGSVGQPRDGDSRSAFAIWHRREHRITFHRVAYDIERTIRDLREVELPTELVERLRTGS